MPVETRYICDKCESASLNEKDMFTLNISLKGYKQPEYTADNKHSKLLCAACVVAVGMKTPEGKPLPPTAPTPSFEDLLRDFISDTVHDAVSDRLSNR